VAAAAKSPDAATSRREGEKVNYINGSLLHTELELLQKNILLSYFN